MSVLDSDKLDGVAPNASNQIELIMLITDHLDWSDEGEHLFALQAKLNAYVHFWEDKQYVSVYPQYDFVSAKIEIRAKYPPSANCKKFLSVAQKQIQELNIYI